LEQPFVDVFQDISQNQTQSLDVDFNVLMIPIVEIRKDAAMENVSLSVDHHLVVESMLNARLIIIEKFASAPEDSLEIHCSSVDNLHPLLVESFQHRLLHWSFEHTILVLHHRVDSMLSAELMAIDPFAVAHQDTKEILTMDADEENVKPILTAHLSKFVKITNV
jgi:hypothetical protein